MHPWDGAWLLVFAGPWHRDFVCRHVQLHYLTSRLCWDVCFHRQGG